MIEGEESNRSTHLYLAECLLRLGAFDEALEHAQAFVKITSKFASDAFIIEQSAGFRQKAAECLQLAEYSVETVRSQGLPLARLREELESWLEFAPGETDSVLCLWYAWRETALWSACHYAPGPKVLITENDTARFLNLAESLFPFVDLAAQGILTDVLSPVRHAVPFPFRWDGPSAVWVAGQRSPAKITLNPPARVFEADVQDVPSQALLMTNRRSPVNGVVLPMWSRKDRRHLSDSLLLARVHRMIAVFREVMPSNLMVLVGSAAIKIPVFRGNIPSSFDNDVTSIRRKLELLGSGQAQGSVDALGQLAKELDELGDAAVCSERVPAITYLMRSEGAESPQLVVVVDTPPQASVCGSSSRTGLT